MGFITVKQFAEDSIQWLNISTQRDFLQGLAGPSKVTQNLD